jgi:hypothetical protein
MLTGSTRALIVEPPVHVVQSEDDDPTTPEALTRERPPAPPIPS